MQENVETKNDKMTNQLTVKDYEDILTMLASVGVQFAAAKRCVEIEDKILAEIERMKNGTD